ncbi:MAG: hypothetical protein PHP25_02130 [Candidatus Moranbacteria bacterium]|nr:hypothetical protein [Candidatus Moranbacteria bacterium]
MKYQDIDQSRSELRFFILLPFLGYFIEKLKEKFRKKLFSRNEIVQTVYLGNVDQIVPGGVSLKARRFLSEFSTRILLSPSDIFLFEKKRHRDSQDWYFREKSPRERRSIKEITDAASSRYGEQLGPYVLVEYHRLHFLPIAESIPLRVTIDTGMRFWHFGQSGPHLIRIDSEIARVECKIENSHIGHILHSFLMDLLLFLGAQPIFSKKDEAYNLVKKHFDEIYARPLIKELAGCEIEAKLTLQDSDPVGFFRKLRAKLENNDIAIGTDPFYPFTFTTSSLNHYWGKQDGAQLNDGLKILFKGVSFKPVTKGEMSLVDPDLAIVKRKETKERKTQYSPEIFRSVVDFYANQIGPLKYVGYLSRSRRAIWPEHRKTKRFYHISLDRCLTSDKSPLYQIEIEYSGLLKEKAAIATPSAKTEIEIVRDTQLLASYILDFAKQEGVNLYPDSLSKFKWLTG